MLKIYEDSINYTCQVIKLPVKIPVQGLDNLVQVTHQGNTCLVSKDTPEDGLYLFFPAECQISHEFLSANNLYRHQELNLDKTQKGFFEDNRRVKCIKFKGVISSGFVCPLEFLKKFNNFNNGKTYVILKVGDEFNEFNNIEICKKFVRKIAKERGMKNPRASKIDNLVDSCMAPEHPDTSHLLKNTHKLQLDDYIAVTYKLHGTSARYYNTLVKRKLSLLERVCKFLGGKVQKTVYELVCASRRCLKSIGLEELPNKNHFYTSGDLWSEVGKEFFEGKLNQGEAVYCEIIGKTYTGEAIQSGYSYGFEKPEVYVYRISNINPQGIEVDLSYIQMKERCTQLGLQYCQELFYGKLIDFFFKYKEKVQFDGYPGSQEELFNEIFYNILLEKPSILDNSVIEEGFCIRKDTCNKPEIFKIKSKLFLLHEGKIADKEINNIEDEQI